MSVANSALQPNKLYKLIWKIKDFVTIPKMSSNEVFDARFILEDVYEIYLRINKRSHLIYIGHKSIGVFDYKVSFADEHFEIINSDHQPDSKWYHVFGNDLNKRGCLMHPYRSKQRNDKNVDLTLQLDMHVTGGSNIIGELPPQLNTNTFYAETNNNVYNVEQKINLKTGHTHTQCINGKKFSFHLHELQGRWKISTSKQLEIGEYICLAVERIGSLYFEQI